MSFQMLSIPTACKLHSYFKVKSRLVPFLPFLKAWQVLPFPAEDVAQVLHTTPATAHVDIVSLEVSRRG